MQDRNSFSISDPIRTKESDHCLVMVQFNMLPPSSPTSHPGRGTNPAIQVQGQWEIIFLSLGKRDPGRWGDESKLDYFLVLKERNRLLAVSQYARKLLRAICRAQVDPGHFLWK